MFSLYYDALHIITIPHSLCVVELANSVSVMFCGLYNVLDDEEVRSQSKKLILGANLSLPITLPFYKTDFQKGIDARTFLLGA